MNILESINKGFDKKYGKLMESCDIKKDECVEEKECDLRHRAKARRRKEDVAVDEACKKEKKAELKEYKNIGQDVAEYQKWVDYDMKRYHKISDKTRREIRDAGLSIVKDQYGDYEVIAKEPVREDKKCDCDKKRKVSIDRKKVVEAIKKEREKKKDDKKLKESLKIVCDFDEYEPWSGAVDTYQKIVDADKLDELERYLEEIFPDGATKTEVNDVLWFDGDEVLHDLGFYTEEVIDIAIQEVIEEAQDERFENIDELKSFLEINLEERVHAIVDVDVYDGKVEITVEDTSRSFALSTFKIDDIDESFDKDKIKINGRKKVTEGVRDYSSHRPYESYREVLADGRLLVANLYVERTRTSTYEIADLILDDKKATGKDRWINRPWYRFRFEKAIRSAAIELGIDSKKLADATVDCHSAEEYVKAIARIIDEGSEKSKE